MCAKILNIQRQYRTHLCTDFDTVCSGTQFELNNRYSLYIRVDNLVVNRYNPASTNKTDYRSTKDMLSMRRKVKDCMDQPVEPEAMVVLDIR